jgi:site-specific recombinase XerC
MSNIGYQVLECWNHLDRIGESKHDAKAEARAEAGTGDWHQTGRRTGIHSVATKQKYMQTWNRLASFAKEGGFKDLEKVNKAVVKAYLNERVEKGISAQSYKVECAALQKLDVAVQALAQNPNRGSWEKHITNHSPKHELNKPEGSRAYDRPQEMIQAIKDDAHRLAANIQYQGGARIQGAHHITSDQLTDRGVNVTEKGGYQRELILPDATLGEIREHIEKNGEFYVDPDKYREGLQEASYVTYQDYSGSHGLRWNFARESMVRHQAQGHGYRASLKIVSEELGHHRPDITLHYLK